MQTYLNENNLVDLISDKHAKLRKKVIKKSSSCQLGTAFFGSRLLCTNNLLKFD